MNRLLGRKALSLLASNRTFSRSLRAASVRGLVTRHVWARLPIDEPFDVRVPGGGAFRYCPVEGDLMARSLYWRGLSGYEAATMTAWATRARHARTVLDIGANTGLFSLAAAAASPAAAVVAFEPVPALAARLSVNVQANGWGSRVTLRTAAATSSQGPVKFLLPARELPMSAHLVQALYRSAEGEEITVDGVRADDAVEDPSSVDLVKIDVEGAEHLVLAGMSEILERGRPDLVIECWDEGPHVEVESVLRAAGYTVAHLRQGGPVPVPRVEPDLRRRDGNFLFTHPGRRVR